MILRQRLIRQYYCSGIQWRITEWNKYAFVTSSWLIPSTSSDLHAELFGVDVVIVAELTICHEVLRILAPIGYTFYIILSRFKSWKCTITCQRRLINRIWVPYNQYIFINVKQTYFIFVHTLKLELKSQPKRCSIIVFLNTHIKTLCLRLYVT